MSAHNFMRHLMNNLKLFRLTVLILFLQAKAKFVKCSFNKKKHQARQKSNEGKNQPSEGGKNKKTTNEQKHSGVSSPANQQGSLNSSSNKRIVQEGQQSPNLEDDNQQGHPDSQGSQHQKDESRGCSSNPNAKTMR